MKEYTICIRQGTAKPYSLHTYNSIYEAKIALMNMVRQEEEHQKPFFIDNDFWDNKYSLVSNLRYFCIKEREVTEWKVYCESNVEEENENSNIIYFANYLK